MSEEQSEVKVSKYNSGVAQIFRLDDLWKKANSFVLAGKFYSWNTVLDRIWCELARDLNDVEYKTKEDEFNKIDKLIGSIKDAGSGDWEKPTQEDIKKRNEQYLNLVKKDLFLRRLENSLGKGTAFDDELEGDMD